jgi:hypothetical protein
MTLKNRSRLQTLFDHERENKIIQGERFLSNIFKNITRGNV